MISNENKIPYRNSTVFIDDIDEQETISSFENGEWFSVLTDERRNQLEQYAKNTFNKDKRVVVEISSKDLYDIEIKAIEEGLSYQTLITSILHKYISGQLIER
ncbi:MAG: antitoxin [Desulfamplus sp.]|nr:antitoxin [Desulfamplus sp.]